MRERTPKGQKEVGKKQIKKEREGVGGESKNSLAHSEAITK